MRFHLLGIPHTVTNDEYTACAYTAKVLKFGKMFTGQPGVEVFHYGHEDSNVCCDEHITVTTNDDLQKAYGSHDWRKEFFKFNNNDHAYTTFYENTLRELNKRLKKNDFVLAFWGSGVRSVCGLIEKEKKAIVVEPGIGYGEGHFAKWKVWESYAIMHACGGNKMVLNCNPNWYDVVIPNYFDETQFEYKEKKEDYFLYLGRVYDGKGVKIAIEASKRAGVKLVIAGQKEKGYKLPDDVEYIGYAGVDKRKELMANAKGSFLPSMYYEPFGGVQIENLFSGTPTITTDWGAFSENNLHGVTGYRCRTMSDFVEAVHNVNDGKIKSGDCRKWANNFSIDNIRPRYKKYFDDVLNVYTGKGWYENKSKESISIEQLKMEYP
jgi:glycosyltransferase involved in cell wall biosynthesis